MKIDICLNNDRNYSCSNLIIGSNQTMVYVR